tara:strand:+ start:833 stop:1648 length:816 start_codon:yes stop_codon:yes gene_type:complete
MLPDTNSAPSFIASLMDALPGIGETALGSALGFFLGLVAFHYQQKRTKAAEETEAQQTAYDAVDRLAQSAALNIEAVAIVKNLLSAKLREDSSMMSEMTERFHEADVEKKPSIISEMKQKSSSLEQFFMFTPMITSSPFPSSDQYAVALREVPILNLLAFRAESIVSQINDIINKRNHIVEMYASALPNEMTVERYLYCVSMLSSSGNGITILLDDCLAMLRLVFDQCDKYLEAKAHGPRRHRYQIAPNALTALPPAGRFETLEAQIIEFE